MAYSKTLFGEMPDGRQVYAYTLVNGHGTECTFLDLGAIWNRMVVKDKNGESRDVILGYDRPEDYLQDDSFFGAIVGRNANRIAGGRFTLEGTEYQLTANNGPNNLHSGLDFYRNRLWEAQAGADETGTYAEFSLWSEDGDQGYPGALDMRVTYSLDEENLLTIHYEAVPDQDTVINMTNHSYFNLNGHDSGSVLEHSVMLNADAFTPADAESIPTGEIRPVEGTPMDFRTAKKLGAEINADYEPLRFGGGYDHNWVLKNENGFDKVAEVTADRSGIRMEVWTDLPGVQMYTANFLDNEPGKDGAVYGNRSAVCLETQYYPDAIHHDNFPGPVCRRGEKYDTRTAYRFVPCE